MTQLQACPVSVRACAARRGSVRATAATAAAPASPCSAPPAPQQPHARRTCSRRAAAVSAAALTARPAAAVGASMRAAAAAAVSAASASVSAAAAPPSDLLIVGPGVLGSLVGTMWLQARTPLRIRCVFAAVRARTRTLTQRVGF
jgi:hypothetical protein